MGFDYGTRREDGQFENHPGLPDNERAQEKRKLPFRHTYIHKRELGGCGKKTQMPRHCAETYAVDPTFYKATFCCECKAYRPVNEFVWWDDGKNLDVSLVVDSDPLTIK